MNEEYLIVWQVFISLIGASIGSLLYMLGGRSGKWKRRIAGSFIIAATVNGISAWRGIWNPWLLGIWPCLYIGFSKGYGADSFWKKVYRRAIYAIGCVSAGLLFFTITLKAVFVLFPHIGIGAWSIYMGVKNPIKASAEEGFICIMLILGLMMYPFI